MRQIEKILQEIAAEESLDYHSYSDGWIIKVNEKLVTGYHFPNNNAGSSNLCNDKSATFEILNEADIPAVSHLFFMEIDEVQIRFLFNHYGSLVIKPNQGTGGSDVYHVTSQTELIPTIEKVLSRSNNMTVSPFENIAQEYRLIILNGDVQLTYKKHVQEGSWKHNLGLGAKPEIVPLDPVLEDMAKRATKVVGINFASVDIVEVDGGFKVLEINSGVMMEKFSLQSDENYEIAKSIYRKALTHLKSN
ncbi:ATP-grasp domain-containing protein [Lactovum miscens]|uniref:Glutathione synthase/RimK-type ligase-like ATP-grasp enzyme n=1 Tax=Lactovum miscens TaxID=190387 RepID=A0A841CC48_9LACT|nr:ATP-grasp domain-containing protein [Lactovum miscens]MBB5888730.1 glutathione synthase/RimK-type ligase-like ATP-grasp enzyme [Lactovum miscens]